MSTRDIKMYIGTQFPRIHIQWINDSSCTISFEDEAQANQAFMQFSVSAAALKVKQPEPAAAVVQEAGGVQEEGDDVDVAAGATEAAEGAAENANAQAETKA